MSHKAAVVASQTKAEPTEWGERALCKGERNELEEEMWKISRRDLEKYGSLDRSERTSAITGGRW